MLQADQVYECFEARLFPIDILKGMRKSFIGWTTNDKTMTFTDRVVDDWLIDKYSLTHYIMINPIT